MLAVVKAKKHPLMGRWDKYLSEMPPSAEVMHNGHGTPVNKAKVNTVCNSQYAWGNKN